jgi:hypothetical protein
MFMYIVYPETVIFWPEPQEPCFFIYRRGKAVQANKDGWIHRANNLKSSETRKQKQNLLTKNVVIATWLSVFLCAPAFMEGQKSLQERGEFFR